MWLAFRLENQRLRVVAHRAARPRRVASYEETSKKRRFSCQPFVFKQTLAGGSALYRKQSSGACIATHQAQQNMTCNYAACIIFYSSFCIGWIVFVILTCNCLHPRHFRFLVISNFSQHVVLSPKAALVGGTSTYQVSFI